jgi:protein-L-isoaspartate O-methyltransferase
MSSLSGMVVATPTDDPIHVYQNVLFALDRQKRINNGEPFLHGQLLGALSPARGNLALHIGCGTGYYTAILAHLVGPSGKVIAYEIEPELGHRAVENLKPWDNVEVRLASGVNDELPRCDAIYVNAGATRPAAGWLDALNEGGKLLFPLVGLQGGVSLLVTRLQDSIAAKVIGFCAFIPCQDAPVQLPFTIHANQFGRPRGQLTIVPRPPSHLQQQTIIGVPADKLPKFILLRFIMEGALGRMKARRYDVYPVIYVVGAVGPIHGREPFMVRRITLRRGDLFFFSVQLAD